MVAVMSNELKLQGTFVFFCEQKGDKMDKLDIHVNHMDHWNT